jgi:EF-hand domain pair/EF hand
MRTHWILAALLATAAPAFAQATDPAPPPPMAGEDSAPGKPPRDPGAMFERIDADGNGAIDATEWASAVEKMGERGQKMGPKLFEAADADGDGTVSRAEWDEARARMQGDRPEPGQMAERAFAEMDTNGDGALSLEEFKAGMEQMRERHGDRREGRDQFRPKR